jgi:hypothetical protein
MTEGPRPSRPVVLAVRGPLDLHERAGDHVGPAEQQQVERPERKIHRVDPKVAS